MKPKPSKEIDRLITRLEKSEDPSVRAELVEWLEKDRGLVEGRLDRIFGPRTLS